MAVDIKSFRLLVLWGLWFYNLFYYKRVFILMKLKYSARKLIGFKWWVMVVNALNNKLHRHSFCYCIDYNLFQGSHLIVHHWNPFTFYFNLTIHQKTPWDGTPATTTIALIVDSGSFFQANLWPCFQITL